MHRPHLSGITTALFAPATVERRVRHALASPAGVVIVDLEDAVPEDGKAAARATAEAILATSERPGTALRVNGAGTAHHTADLALAARLRLDAIVLPKATPEAVDGLGDDGPPVWALIETADGLRRAYDVARRARVQRLLLGSVDLAAELGLVARDDGLELLHARSCLVLESAAAGLPAPLDGVCLSVRDPIALQREARLARSLGFGGKLCIHPDQLAVVGAVFAAGEHELAWARRVIDAAAVAARDGQGAVLLDGAMVDRPVVERARQLLATANQERP
jgi:citrate lyase subunit beta/citryl-CoA lyase